MSEDTESKSGGLVKAKADEEAVRKRNIARSISAAANEKGNTQLGAIKLDETDSGVSLSLRAEDQYDGHRLIETFSVKDIDAGNRLLAMLLEANCRSQMSAQASVLNGLIALVHELEPKDAAEAMLCCQIVSTHALAMDCIAKANRSDQTLDGRNFNLRHAERLMRIFNQQIDALNKHRGKGQQKVTVEHVTVNEGGQAVVGAVGNS